MKLLYLFLVSCLMGNAYGMNWDKDLPPTYKFQVKKDDMNSLGLLAVLSKKAPATIEIHSTVFKNSIEFEAALKALQPVANGDYKSSVMNLIPLEYILAKQSFDSGFKLGKEKGSQDAFNERYNEGYNKAKSRFFWQGLGTGVVILFVLSWLTPETTKTKIG